MYFTWGVLLDVQSTAYSCPNGAHDLVDLNKWGRERERREQSYREVQLVQGKSHFPVIRLTPISGFKRHITWSLRQPARWMSVIPLVNWKSMEEQKGKKCVRAEMKEEEDWVGGSCSGFISVWLLADPGPAANHWTMRPAHPSTCQDRWLTTGQRKLALLWLVLTSVSKGQLW